MACRTIRRAAKKDAANRTKSASEQIVQAAAIAIGCRSRNVKNHDWAAGAAGASIALGAGSLAPSGWCPTVT
jgi:hypothetical protein